MRIFTQASIKQKLLLGIGSAVALLLLATALLVVSHIKTQTEHQVNAEVTHTVAQEAASIAGFFAQYGQVARTFLETPQFQYWFASYPGRGAVLSNVANYQQINQTFIGISERDPNILSAFFALDSSGEYFRENARTGVANEGADAGDVTKGYFANKRPWYQLTLERNRYFVNSPSADMTTGIISTVVQGPVRDSRGKLLGVGGLDLHINKVGEHVEQLNFQGHGLPLLLDEQGNIVHFSKAANISYTPNDPLSAFDRDGNQGFAELANAAKQGQSSRLTIRLNGIDYFAYTQPVTLEFPALNWMVALLVPVDNVTAPVSSATNWALLLTLAIVLVTLAVIWLMTTAMQLQLEDAPKKVGPLPKLTSDSKREEAIKLYGSGLLYEKENRLLDALRSFEKAMELDPGALSPRKALIPIYMSLDRIEDALVQCRYVLDRDDSSLETFALYAKQLAALGKIEEVTEILEKLMKNPASKDKPELRLQVLRELSLQVFLRLAAKEHAGVRSLS